MTMKRFVLPAAILLLAFPAQAQIYQWQDENNRTVISDLPPTGKVRQQRKIEAEAPPADADPDRTMADREMEFRKRQKLARENAEKAEKEERASAQKRENCDIARRNLQVLESGDRVVSHDSQGERYYLDEKQLAQEVARVRQIVQLNCR